MSETFNAVLGSARMYELEQLVMHRRVKSPNKRIQRTVNPVLCFVHFAALNCCTNHRSGLPAADAGR